MLAIVLMVIASVWWWAGTDGSLAQSVRLAQNCCGRPLQALTIEQATGSLRSGGHINSLKWQQGGLTVEAKDVSLAWQSWSLLHNKVKIDRIAAASVLINDQRPPSATPSSGPPEALSLPLQVELDEFSAGSLQFVGASVPSSSSSTAGLQITNIAGKYDYNGQRHQLKLAHAGLASGIYQGRATLSDHHPLTLDATALGTVTVAVPGSKTELPLSFAAAAQGALTELQVRAALQTSLQNPAQTTTTASLGKFKPGKNTKKQPAKAEKTVSQPQASLTATITPWATQPVPQADANFRELNIAAFWPEAPQTMLTGQATVRPLTSTTASSSTATNAAWLLDLQLSNSLPGPMDKQRLPLENLQTVGEWRGGMAMVRSLKATAGGGEVLASGQWSQGTSSSSQTTATSTSSTQAWKLQATLKNVDPAQMHSQFAALPLSGQASASSQGDTIVFDADLQAASGQNKSASNPLGQLRLQNASATGSWNPQLAGGTLLLSALKLRTDDAELSGQLEAQPAAQGGKARLKLTAPGLDASVQGELRPNSGAGDLKLNAKNTAQTLRWLQKLPVVGTALQNTSLSGAADLSASWQGGWKDPAVQARLGVPSMDIGLPTTSSTTAALTPTTASSFKLRDLQTTLSGRLSQAQISAQGRVEAGARRYKIQLAADTSRITTGSRSSATLADDIWQAVLKQLDISVEDPALSAGSWRLATRGPVSLKWTPTLGSTGSQTAVVGSGVFESSEGTAILNAPTATASAATINWQPIRWRGGELSSAGKISGLQMGWIELLAGPQLAGVGLTGNLVFDGEWDARLGETLSLKASLARSSGDITMQAETAEGGSTRVAAGVRQARIALTTDGDELLLALRWETERAGNAEGQLKTRLTKSAEGGWLWAADAPLNGQLRAQLPRIGVWSVLAPPGWRIRGSLGTNIAISGNRSAPQLAGELQANDLALRSVVDGIEFGNGKLRATLDGTRMRINEFTLQGAGDKGTGGIFSAQGEAAWLDGQPRVQLDANIERLRASIRTDRQITVSGKLQAKLEGKLAQFTGALKVDQARILLPEEGTPQLGDDVVVRNTAGAGIGKKAPAETASPQQAKAPLAPSAESGRAIKLEVQLDLGRDFKVQGKGIDTQVRGVLALYGDSTQRGSDNIFEPRLVGTVNTFGGQYRAYGQRLDVEQGVLRFSGPIDNPALDILAIRPNLTQRVGVQIT
ncbi:MAG: translocation/assembly module TamB domain-containing protein, partial [Pseudomonadota bacterium]